MAKVSKSEYDQQLTQLRQWCPPGSTVYTILEHVSRSGMQRTIKVLVPYVHDRAAVREMSGSGIDFIHPNYATAIVTGYSLDKGRGRAGVKVGGCGMDMGFALVHSLSERLWGGARCACGAWEDDSRPGQRFTQEQYLAREGGGRASDGWHWRYLSDCPKCAGSGNVIGTGYQCLGKGKCPSPYHSNHRDRVRCEGTRVHNPDGPDTGSYCRKPSRWHGEEIPADWPMKRVDVGEGAHIDLPLSCVEYEPGAIPVGTKDLIMAEDGSARQVCPTCKGDGDLPNPDGPERFDLEHFDGYALRHRWL